MGIRDKSLKANEKVVPESEVKKLKVRIKELERALGKKTLRCDILEEAVEIAREKKADLARELVRRGRAVKPVAEAMAFRGPI